MKTTIRKIILGALAVVIVQSACTFDLPSINQSTSGDPTQAAIPPGIYPPAFAAYHEISASLPASFSGGYTLPVDLGGVQNMDTVQLTEAQRALLAQNGFVVTPPVPGEYREFYQVYENGRYMDIPVFITTDSVYHVYHLIFDKMLRDLETRLFHRRPRSR